MLLEPEPLRRDCRRPDRVHRQPLLMRSYDADLDAELPKKCTGSPRAASASFCTAPLARRYMAAPRRPAFSREFTEVTERVDNAPETMTLNLEPAVAKRSR